MTSCGGGGGGGAPALTKAEKKTAKRLRDEAKAGASTAIVNTGANKREKLPPHVVHGKLRGEYYGILSQKGLVLKGVKRCHPHDISLVDGYGAYANVCDCDIRARQCHAGEEIVDDSGVTKTQTQPPLPELGALLLKYAIPKIPKIVL